MVLDVLAGVGAVLAAILLAAVAALARMAYRNARDVAALAQRVAYLEGARWRRKEEEE